MITHNDIISEIEKLKVEEKRLMDERQYIAAVDLTEERLRLMRYVTNLYIRLFEEEEISWKIF